MPKRNEAIKIARKYLSVGNINEKQQLYFLPDKEDELEVKVTKQVISTQGGLSKKEIAAGKELEFIISKRISFTQNIAAAYDLGRLRNTSKSSIKKR